MNGDFVHWPCLCAWWKDAASWKLSSGRISCLSRDTTTTTPTLQDHPGRPTPNQKRSWARDPSRCCCECCCCSCCFACCGCDAVASAFAHRAAGGTAVVGDGGAGGTYVLAPVLLVLVLLVLLALALGLMLFVLWLVVALVAKANKRAAGCPKEKNSLASVLKKATALCACTCTKCIWRLKHVPSLPPTTRRTAKTPPKPYLDAPFGWDDLANSAKERWIISAGHQP